MNLLGRLVVLVLLLPAFTVMPAVTVITADTVLARDTAIDTSRGDRMIAAYFKTQTSQLEDAGLQDIKSLEAWEKQRSEYRRRLLEMLGLDPLPKRTPLQPKITGTTEHDEFVVEQIQFQSRPGLYVTGNLYRPRDASGQRLPAILYVCGHGKVKIDGISYGNKVHYQHHGAWFARHGYVCLTIDTLQMGEIEGTHHGTYRYDMWWWLNRGYTPAGVEAWNCMRALDYLQSRKEVDGERLGVTGRSGGGAYSWWIAAIDERIKAAVPVAGITDMRNHVVDGCVEGHCDCMYMVNTYRWDYPMVAALVAPRPLLISNTDSDRIFPLDGVVRTFSKVRRIYELYGAADKVALNITAGPHKDTQELRVHAFRWFNHHLKKDDGLLEKPAVRFFEPSQLRVFEQTPDDQQNTKIHDTFVEVAAPTVPDDKAQWDKARDGWRDALRRKSFAAWPGNDSSSDPPSAATGEVPPLDVREVFSHVHEGVRLSAYDFVSQKDISLRLYVAHRDKLKQPKLTVLNVLDTQSWTEFLATMRPGFEAQLREETLPPADADRFKKTRQLFESFPWAMAYVAPRGIGPTAWDQSERKQIQHRRRFYLLGQTLDAMRVWDVRRAVQSLRTIQRDAKEPIWLQSHRRMAGVTLYAAMFEPNIARLDLYQLPASHREGPYFLNVRRFLDIPQAVAMAAENSRVVLYDDSAADWSFPQQVVERLGWDKKQLQLRKPPE